MIIFQNPEDINAKVALTLVSGKLGECDALAFAEDDTLTLSVRVPRVFLCERAFLRLYRDADMSREERECRLVDFGDSCDAFELTLELSELGEGLYYFDFVLEGVLPRAYVCSDGSVTASEFAVSSLQLTVYSAAFKTPDRFKGGMIYQIFPDRFARSGRVSELPNGRIFNPDWENGIPQYAERPGGEVANNEFFGGDLWGIAERLDYISSLGVDTLYLCPIFKAASNHRYDTGEYGVVDPLLGGEAALENLLAELKKRGMKLILDGVFNHTGADSKYFNKFGNYSGSGAYNSKHSRYYKWYSFEEYPEKYRCWWGVKILPAVKSDEVSYREFICGKNGIVSRMLKKGIDGWRLDVADELSDVFLDELRSSAKETCPDSLILGEVWEDASNKVAYDRRRRYFRGAQLDSVMNYPLKEGIIDFVLTGDCSRLREIAERLWRHYPRCVSAVLMNLLGTHDTERILTVLADVGTDKMTNDELAHYRLSVSKRTVARERLKLAWALLCAFPGIPCLYYGDEAGMEGGRDPFNRLPFDRKKADRELTSFFRRIGNIRRTESVFADGRLEFIDSGDPACLVFARENESERLIVAANLSARYFELEFESSPERLIGISSLRDSCFDSGDGKFVKIAPMSVEYFKI